MGWLHKEEICHTAAVNKHRLATLVGGRDVSSYIQKVVSVILLTHLDFWEKKECMKCCARWSLTSGLQFASEIWVVSMHTEQPLSFNIWCNSISLEITLRKMGGNCELFQTECVLLCAGDERLQWHWSDCPVCRLPRFVNYSLVVNLSENETGVLAGMVGACQTSNTYLLLSVNLVERCCRRKKYCGCSRKTAT